MAALTWSLLSSLYEGRGGVVEHLSSAERAAIAVDTPLVGWLRKRAQAPEPRHIVLSGSAGDGKTFAVASARAAEWPFYEVLDASDRPPDELARQLGDALSQEERLLVAINRGQLERLRRHLAGATGALGDLMTRVGAQLTPRHTWGSLDPVVGVIDLGWVDSTSEGIAGAVLNRVANASLSTSATAPTRQAAQLAQQALSDPVVRRRVLSVLRRASGGGQHITMRQLWAWAAYLVTGGRSEDDPAPISLEDLLGARVFHDRGLAPVRRGASGSLRGDPATEPQPELVLTALTHAELPAGVGVPPGLALGSAPGPSLARVAWLHGLGLGVAEPSVTRPYFDQARAAARERPHAPATAAAAERLLDEVMRALGHTEPLVWQRLCFDSSRLEDAPAVATHKLDHDPTLAIPAPPPWCAEALRGCWVPPFVWLGVGPEESRATVALRPSQVQRLFKGVAGDADLLVMRRWLGRTLASSRALTGADVQRPGSDGVLRVRPAGGDRVVLRVQGQL